MPTGVIVHRQHSQRTDSQWPDVPSLLGKFKPGFVVGKNISLQGMLTQRLQFTSYFAFSAMVVLFVYLMQHDPTSTDSYQTYLSAATECQKELSNIAEPGSLAARYCIVLAELRAEIILRCERVQAASPPREVAETSTATLGQAQADTLHSIDFNAMVDQQPTGSSELPSAADHSQMNDTSPESSLADLSSWVQFECMVIM